MGTLAGGLGCFPLDDESSHPPSHAPAPLRGIRRLVRVGKRQAPSPIQRATSAQPQPEAAPKCISGRTSYLRVRLAFHRSPQLIRAFCNRRRCGPPRACSARFSLATVRSPGFGSIRNDSLRPFGLAVAAAPPVPGLACAAPVDSSAHSTKGTPSPQQLTLRGSDRPEAHGFRFCFTPLAGVLFTVPSRYWSTIGRWRYLALGRGRPCFRPDVACPALLTIQNHPARSPVAYGVLTLSDAPFQRASAQPSCPGEAAAAPSVLLVQPPSGIAGRLSRPMGLGSSPFARRYWGNPLCSSRY